MFELQFLIPLSDNEARAFTKNHHGQFEREILSRFGGLSMLPGTVAGQWIGAARTHYDTLRIYSVGIESITQGGLVGELAEIAKTLYRQESIFVRYLGQAEIL